MSYQTYHDLLRFTLFDYNVGVGMKEAVRITKKSSALINRSSLQRYTYHFISRPTYRAYRNTAYIVEETVTLIATADNPIKQPSSYLIPHTSYHLPEFVAW